MIPVLAEAPAASGAWRPAREQPQRGEEVFAVLLDGNRTYGHAETTAHGFAVVYRCTVIPWGHVMAWMPLPPLPAWARP